MSYIEIKDLMKDYISGDIITKVLKKINLEIKKSDFMALAGASGSGKTTLLNLIGGLDSCTAGEIIFDGSDLTKMSKSELCTFRRNNLGFVFQSYNLIPVLTAYENVEYPLILKKVSAIERKSIVENMLEKVGLGDKMKSRPRQLSGGQQQRVSIARALVSNPALVLADEPTANLDSVVGGSIIELIKSLNIEMGVTFLFSTHDQRIMKYADRVINLNDGKIV
ncbi:MAG: ABC transporter ATP-binding protein [Herbinix sp.]|nr:ABC transporter ATP-binding protein [Herbinix sp.]